MIAGLKILSSGFLGAIQGQNIGEKIRNTPTSWGWQPPDQKLLNHATPATYQIAIIYSRNDSYYDNF
jgi:hypothetical protein